MKAFSVAGSSSKIMKFNKDFIPDTVKNEIVYSDGETEYRAAGGEIRSKDKKLSSKEVHDFEKIVVSSNKTNVLRHMLNTGFSLHLDMIYLASQHGALEMVKLFMDVMVITLNIF